MLFYESFFIMNIFPIVYAVSLCWYFGGSDAQVYPDKVLGSIVSYCEKSLVRKGSFEEGLAALLISLAASFMLALFIMYFAAHAGYFWYFSISTAFLYFSLDKSFTVYEHSRSTTVQFMSYTLPVIIVTLLFSPAGAVAYRTLVLMVKMLPTENERFARFGKPAEKLYMVTRDAAGLLIPMIVWTTYAFRKGIRKLKALRP